MDEIAERADVARATVFNHFQRKEAFLPAYLAQRRERLAGLLAEKLAGAATATARLYQAFDLLADVNEAAPAETRELISAWWRTGGSQVTDPDTGLLFADLIRQGKQRGEFRADLDPQLAGTLLLDAYVGTVLRWIAADPHRSHSGPPCAMSAPRSSRDSAAERRHFSRRRATIPRLPGQHAPAC